MNAQSVANALVAQGCSYTAVIEPIEDLPGRIQITDTIHVQVPAEGDVLHVVMKLTDGELVFGRPRKRIGYVEQDISCAIHQWLASPLN